MMWIHITILAYFLSETMASCVPWGEKLNSLYEKKGKIRFFKTDVNNKESVSLKDKQTKSNIYQ